MSTISYRRLGRDEARLLGVIDRAEQIDGMYRVLGGLLQLHPARLEVPGWAPEELAAYVWRIEALHDAGGVVLGAWDGSQLVGLGSLEVGGVGGDRTVLKLDMLYVGASHRNRGIGRELTKLLSVEARARGAKVLYVSATPHRNTVEAYLRMGARVLATPDPKLFELEPEDVHLTIDLT